MSCQDSIRKAALLRDRGLCCNCQEAADHVHHVVPMARGGRDVLSNVVSLCQSCHGLVHERRFNNHRELTKAGMAAAKARGTVFGANRPDVATLNAARARIADANAERLRRLLAPMVQARQSLRDMAAALEAAGVTTAAGSKTWSPMQVSRALKRLKLASVAEFESRRISERTREAMAAAKARGAVFGSSRPDVAALNAIRAQQAAEGAERLRGLLTPMANEGQSLRAMAAALEAARVLTPAGASSWSPAQVQRALKRLDLSPAKAAA